MSQRADKPDEAKINEYIERFVTIYRLLWSTFVSDTETTFPRIHYSDRYSDDQYEYRHVILPKPLFKLIPKSYFNNDDSGTLRLLADHEWRGIGIQQSLGWVHYEIHGMFVDLHSRNPEPNTSALR